MSPVKSQLQKSLGTIKFMALMKVLRSLTICIDAESQRVTIFRHGHDPATISFHDLEKLVNDEK